MRIDCPTKQYVEANQVATIQYVNEQISKNQKQNNMNKSKFKTVKFKPLKLTLQYNGDKKLWGTKYIFPEVYYGTEVRFTEQYIWENPELFEVEKAEREFEDGAYYKVKWKGFDVYHVALCEIGRIKNGVATFTIPNCFPQYIEAFQEIGERIEL